MFLNVCRNWQWWVPRNSTQIPRFTESLCVCNYTQSGWDRPTSHSSRWSSNYSDFLSIEWVVAEICKGCSTWEKQSFIHMAIDHWTQWLWYQSEWSPAALRSGTNECIAWPDEPTEHHGFDNIPDSGVSGRIYDVTYRARRRHGFLWWQLTIIISAVWSMYASGNIQPTQFHHLMQNSQIVWKIKHSWGVQEYWLEYDSILW